MGLFLIVPIITGAAETCARAERTETCQDHLRKTPTIAGRWLVLIDPSTPLRCARGDGGWGVLGVTACCLRGAGAMRRWDKISFRPKRCEASRSGEIYSDKHTRPEPRRGISRLACSSLEMTTGNVFNSAISSVLSRREATPAAGAGIKQARSRFLRRSRRLRFRRAFFQYCRG